MNEKQNSSVKELSLSSRIVDVLTKLALKLLSSLANYRLILYTKYAIKKKPH